MLHEKLVQVIAEKFVSSHDQHGFDLRFALTMRDDRRPKEWSVVFDVFTPSGDLLDGPVVVIVSDETNEARFL
ncbi:hypothetical protein [Caenimonas koreensis]|uniref:Uncharacterized protein n=1 Tax=Caenimonas koreensis DSM 17982 TaxID=1121255 RepID=A0A844AX66_9BURK|nr:hypothetical protein [Caenimonas koreensis]MRD46968.1 hypothetical protein [Caenimonas koreensis DSM 17982]